MSAPDRFRITLRRADGRYVREWTTTSRRACSWLVDNLKDQYQDNPGWYLEIKNLKNPGKSTSQVDLGRV